VLLLLSPQDGATIIIVSITITATPKTAHSNRVIGVAQAKPRSEGCGALLSIPIASL
jgi:hypothetical protein